MYVHILDACIHVRAHFAQIILANDELKQSLPTMLAKLDWQRDSKGKRALTQSLRDNFKQLHCCRRLFHAVYCECAQECARTHFPRS